MYTRHHQLFIMLLGTVAIGLSATLAPNAAHAAGQQQQQPQAAAAVAPPKYSELPVGRMTAPPADKDKPTSIPSNESVPGIRILTNSGSSASQMLSVVVDGTTKDGTLGMPTTVEGVGGCMSQLQASALAGGLNNAAPSFSTDLEMATPSPLQARSLEWEGNLMWQASIWSQTPPTPTPAANRIYAIHGERIVEQHDGSGGGGGPSLESTDAWLDSSTRGVRFITKASLPLKQVGTAPGGIRIFVGRDERPDGRRYVQFVMTRAKDTPFAQVQAVFAARSDGSTFSTGACSHHRVGLLVANANKTGVKAGEVGDTGLLQLTTILPDLPPGERSNALPLPEAPPGQNTKDLRSRLIRTHFSVSQTSRDKEPILAVSTSWAGPEISQRVFLPVKTPSAAPAFSVSFPASKRAAAAAAATAKPPAPRAEPGPPPRDPHQRRVDKGF